MAELYSVLIYTLCWVLITYIVSFSLDNLMKREVLPPIIWWVGLLITLVIFVPIPYLQVFETSGLGWITDNLSVSQAIVSDNSQLSENAILSAVSQHIALLVIGVVFSISIAKLDRLYQNYTKLQKLVNNSIPFNADTSSYPIFVTQINTSAFVAGVRNPVVGVPTYFLSLSRRQQEILLAHEYTHIQNNDHISVLMWRIISCVCWFNPFLKDLEAGFNKSVELRCDTHTVNHYSFSPKEYAYTLLMCLKRNNDSSLGGLPLAHIASGFSVEDHKKRLTNILNPNIKVMGKRSFALWTLGLLCIVLSVNSASHSVKVSAGESEGDIEWKYPVEHPKISSPFGHVSYIRNNNPHQGLDLMAETGTPVYASATGKVLVASNDKLPSAYGLAIVLQHKDQWQSMYAHLSQLNVKPGQMVKQGEVIGYIGSTGRTTGPHLHFEIARKNKRMDPLPLLKKSAAEPGLM